MSRPRRRPSLVAASVGLAILLLGGPVVAGEPGRPPFLLWTGHFGVVSLIDNPTFGGATCFYQPGMHPDLQKIKVRRPIVFAYDRVSGRVDEQVVGWRYLIEYSDDLSQWATLYRSTVQKATATEATNADFRPRSHAFTSTHSYYRVLVRAYWYRNGSVDGQAGIYPLYYGIEAGFQQFYPWYCPDPLVS